MTSNKKLDAVLHYLNKASFDADKNSIIPPIDGNRKDLKTSSEIKSELASKGS